MRMANGCLYDIRKADRLDHVMTMSADIWGLAGELARRHKPGPCTTILLQEQLPQGPRLRRQQPITAKALAACICPYQCIVDHTIKVLDVTQAITPQLQAVGNKAHSIVTLYNIADTTCNL